MKGIVQKPRERDKKWPYHRSRFGLAPTLLNRWALPTGSGVCAEGGVSMNTAVILSVGLTMLITFVAIRRIW